MVGRLRALLRRGGQGSRSTGAGLVMNAAFQPDRLTAEDLLDVRLAVTFQNTGADPVELYASAARFAVEGGWAGPTWHLETASGGTLIQLRWHQGPPGMPPTADFYAAHRRRLRSGRGEGHVIRATFVPAVRLRPEHLSPDTLDPEGMDGWSTPESGASLLVFARSREEVAAEMARRPDFLRPAIILILRRGDTRLRLRYQQHPGTGFAPASSMAVEATCSLSIG